MLKILINVTNARNVGGGLQVVCNFLRKTIASDRNDVEWYYAVSETLDQVYLDEDFKKNISKDHYYVYPNQPDFRHSYVTVQNELRHLEEKIRLDVIYTMLGPCYNFFKTKEVIRFCHPWVLTSNEYAWKTLKGKRKLRMKLHVWFLKLLLRRIDYFVTQTDTVKNGLIEIMRKESNKVKVVGNVLPAIYKTMDSSHISLNDGKVHIAAVGAGAHKNLDIIPDILNVLRQKLGVDNFVFHLTLPNTARELGVINRKAKELGVLGGIFNHGNMKQQELAEMYKYCDLCLLPTVLEVFSASSIEAMFFKLPTVATNLSFNTEVLKDSCLYYTPMNAQEAALSLFQLYQDRELQQSLVYKMQQRLRSFCDYDNYFNETVDFLVNVCNNKI